MFKLIILISLVGCSNVKPINQAVPPKVMSFKSAEPIAEETVKNYFTLDFCSGDLCAGGVGVMTIPFKSVIAINEFSDGNYTVEYASNEYKLLSNTVQLVNYKEWLSQQ